jgi:hypothetical protein
MPAPTPSAIQIIGGIAEITLNGRYGSGKRALIDAADVHIAQGYSWHVAMATIVGDPYVSSFMRGKNVRLHRLIMNARPWELVDHWNHDTLDCGVIISGSVQGLRMQ